MWRIDQRSGVARVKDTSELGGDCDLEEKLHIPELGSWQ